MNSRLQAVFAFLGHPTKHGNVQVLFKKCAENDLKWTEIGGRYLILLLGIPRIMTGVMLLMDVIIERRVLSVVMCSEAVRSYHQSIAPGDVLMTFI